MYMPLVHFIYKTEVYKKGQITRSNSFKITIKQYTV